MSFSTWIVIAALAATPVAATALEKPKSIGPADPAAPVSVVAYESPFATYQKMVDDAAPPAKVWRAANDEMGRLGGHAGHIKVSGASKASPATPAMPSGHKMNQKSKGK